MGLEPLDRYYKILSSQEKARYLMAGELDEKIQSAKEIFRKCCFCERRCHINREIGEKGYCGVSEARISSEFIHIGEESPLVPSHTIFFSGCSFHCVYCQNYDISYYPGRGIHYKPDKLAQLIKNKTARNVNWVGGEPTSSILYILEVLNHLDKNTPQIFNSNMYLTEESMNLLDGVIDVYLTDFKYGNDRCASRLSDVREYMRITERNHLIARKQAEMIIRHLVLPGHIECCTKPLLDWIKHNLTNVYVNVMGQYRPMYRANEYEEIRRPLQASEFNEAISYARNLGLTLI